MFGAQVVKVFFRFLFFPFLFFFALQTTIFSSSQCLTALYNGWKPLRLDSQTEWKDCQTGLNQLRINDKRNNACTVICTFLFFIWHTQELWKVFKCVLSASVFLNPKLPGRLRYCMCACECVCALLCLRGSLHVQTDALVLPCVLCVWGARR